MLLFPHSLCLSAFPLHERHERAMKEPGMWVEEYLEEKVGSLLLKLVLKLVLLFKKVFFTKLDSFSTSLNRSCISFSIFPILVPWLSLFLHLHQKSREKGIETWRSRIQSLTILEANSRLKWEERRKWSFMLQVLDSLVMKSSVMHFSGRRPWSPYDLLYTLRSFSVHSKCCDDVNVLFSLNCLLPPSSSCVILFLFRFVSFSASFHFLLLLFSCLFHCPSQCTVQILSLIILHVTHWVSRERGFSANLLLFSSLFSSTTRV